MDGKTDMKKMLSRLPEQYQDVIWKGEVYEGKRTCGPRWDMFHHHIPPHATVLEIGSSLGYFSRRIAQFYPDSLVVSFESDPDMVAIQKKIFKQEGIYNVVLCQTRLKAEDLAKWNQYVEFFDVVLALSVLHHYPEDKVATVINALEGMAPTIIGEIPEKEETGACGGEATKKCWEVLGDVEYIGSAQSHVGANHRRLWVKRGSVHKGNLDAFFGVDHEDRHRFTVNNFLLNNKQIIRGANAWNLLHFNIKWPESDWWRVQARAAYNSIEKKSDVRPWNLLVTSSGLRAIDYKTEFPKGDKAGFKQADMTKLDEIFTKMQPGELY